MSAINETPAGAKHTYVMFSALFTPHVGGVEAYTTGLAHALIAQGHRVIVATSQLSKKDAPYEVMPDGTEVYRLPCHALMDGRLPIAVNDTSCAQQLEIIAAARPDRVVINTRFYGHSLLGAHFARKHQIPAIVIEHGSAHLSLGNPAADVAVQRYEHAITNHMKSFGFPFFAVSKQASAWLEHFGIAGSGIVANALDATAFAESASERNFREELGLTSDDVLVASVGRLVPEKGIAAILEAAQWLGAQDAAAGDAQADDAKQPQGQAQPHFVFAIAGDGPLYDQAAHAGSNVAALGRASSADVAALLRDADVYVLPSRSEGFATTLLEAAAMGAYPLATQVGGTDELGIGREGGIVLPDASAASIIAGLQVYADNRAVCEQQAHRLSELVRANNTWEASARQLDEAFEGIAAHTAATDASAENTASANDSDVFEGDERLDQLHRVLLMMIKDFAAICERENIPWFAHYGTAIGALRHGGFIPWDDDIDILLMREDLNRFIAAVQADPSDKYFIVNCNTHAGYPLSTTRFVLKGTEFRDSSLATMDFPSGIFLDLFPLDALADGTVAYQYQTIGAWFFNKLAIAKLAPDAHIVAKGLTGKVIKAGTDVTRGVLNLPGIRALDPNNVSTHFLEKHAGEQTRRVGYPCDTVPTTCIYNLADMTPVRWVPFEDTMIPLPNKIEQQLTELYGDWMTPPPGDERKAHYPDILDFGPYANI